MMMETKSAEVTTAGTQDGTELLPSPLASSLAERLMVADAQPNIKAEPCTIPRVPLSIREVDGKSCDPQFVSVGPYHHGKPALLAMEVHKWRFLHNLVSRTLKVSHEICTQAMSSELEKYVRAVRQSEPRLRRYYSETVSMGSDQFVSMMILDGCFIVELLIKFYSKTKPDGDPIFAVAWMLPLIRRDLLKLENQVPFFLLEQLFDVATAGLHFPSLKEISFIYLVLKRCHDPSKLADFQVHHLLHFYDWILRPTSCPSVCKPRPSPASSLIKKLCPLNLCSFNHKPRPEYSGGTIPCAANLLKAGIKFRLRKEADSLLDIRLVGKNVLEIPQISIVDGTKSIFRNLVAFEQCCSDAAQPPPLKHFTSYALFMDCIVDTAEDVAILREHGIVENKIGSDEEVAHLFNHLCKEVIISYSRHHFAELFKSVNAYYGSKLRIGIRRKKP